MSSYIGNADEKQLYADNLREDLVVTDPSGEQSVFPLDQEVPGGYEINVEVYRQRFEEITLIKENNTIYFDATTSTIRSDDLDTARLLYAHLEVGYQIITSGATNPENNTEVNTLSKITDIIYDEDATPNIIIEVVETLIDESAGADVNISLGKRHEFERLEPILGYTIDGVGSPTKYKQITIVGGIIEEDVCYVIHRASATYNFVPTNNSVTPDKLSHNLRNFVVDRFDGDNLETDFLLSQHAINTKSLLVHVDGAPKDGEDGAFAGDWTLITGGTPEQPTSTISFTVAPGTGTNNIRVLHLGFSTVSRRALLSDGQIAGLPDGSVENQHLSTHAVTNIKIADNSIDNRTIINNGVNDSKFFLRHQQYLRSEDGEGGEIGILRYHYDGVNRVTTINSNSRLAFAVAGSIKFYYDYDNDLFGPVEDDKLNLGKPGQRYKSLHLSQDANIDGDIVLQPGKTVDGVDVSELALGVAENTPVGSIIMFAGSSAPSGWAFCDGANYDGSGASAYAALYAVIGTTYGGTGDSNFYVPDMRQRFPICKTNVAGRPADSLGEINGGALNGSATNIGHDHSISHSHNVSVGGAVPAHSHNLGSSAVATAANHTHTLNLPQHRHKFEHTHMLPKHTHGNFSLSFNHQLAGVYGADPGVSVWAWGAGDKTSAPPTFLYARTSGWPGQTIDTLNFSNTFTEGDVGFSSWHSFPWGNYSSRVPNTGYVYDADHDYYEGTPYSGIALPWSGQSSLSLTPHDNPSAVYAFDFKNYTDYHDEPNRTTSANKSTISMSGSTNSKAGYTLTSSGSTTSQSGTTSGDETPYYFAVNFIIKL